MHTQPTICNSNAETDVEADEETEISNDDIKALSKHGMSPCVAERTKGR
jgi:hypothetical protein